MIVNAQDIAQTRLCAAASCPNDAEHGWALCRYCETRRTNGARIVIHEIVQPRIPDQDRELWCTSCQEWLHDEAFPLCAAERNRRGRHKECRLCCARRRRESRANMTPEQHRSERAREAAAKRRRNAERTPDQWCAGVRSLRHGRCRNYPLPGHAYCARHLDQAHLQALLEAQ